MEDEKSKKFYFVSKENKNANELRLNLENSGEVYSTVAKSARKLK